jgi:hypothetical protein
MEGGQTVDCVEGRILYTIVNFKLRLNIYFCKHLIVYYNLQVVQAYRTRVESLTCPIIIPYFLGPYKQASQ